jgi:hypothetical protein
LEPRISKYESGFPSISKYESDSHHPTAIFGFIEGRIVDFEMHSKIKGTM